MKEQELFEKENYKIKKPIRLVELFGGVGSQAMALRDLGANFTHYRLVEYDKYPVASYNAIHGTSFEPMDITKVTGEDLGIVDTDKYEYIMTYSFPCQDLSVAGKMKGMTKGTGTRSGLLWEVERLLNEVENLPQILLMENVKQVIGKGNKDDFVLWCQFLESKGYTNHWKVLNAKDYGVAQNRERCFMVSILGDYDYEFSAPIPLTKTMKDYLDEVVDEKYYINNERAMELINKVKDGVKCTLPTEPHQAHCAIGGRDGRSLEWKEYSPCLCARDYKDPKVVSVPNNEESNPKRIGNIYGDDKGTGFAGNVWDNNSVLPTLTTMQGGNRQPMTIVNIKQATKQGYIPCEVGGVADLSFPDSTTRRGRVQDNGQVCPTLMAGTQYICKIEIQDSKKLIGNKDCVIQKVGDRGTNKYNTKEISNTLPANPMSDRGQLLFQGDYRIRKLTPLECWRLMGFSDDDFNKAATVNSNTQLYKQAGNSIVKDVLMAILEKLIK